MPQSAAFCTVEVPGVQRLSPLRPGLTKGKNRRDYLGTDRTRRFWEKKMPENDFTPYGLVYNFDEGSNRPKYIIVRIMKRGGTALIYEALQIKRKELGRRLQALEKKDRAKEIEKSSMVSTRKVVLKKYDNTEIARQNFRTEADTLNALEDIAGIIPAYDQDEDPKSLYLVVPYGESDLETEITGNGFIPLNRVMEIIMAIVTAMGKAHDKEIVHCDLKPRNIFFVGDDKSVSNLKIGDFGTSKFLQGREACQSLGMDRQITPEFTPPEILDSYAGYIPLTPDNEGPHQKTSDVFSLGLILYCLLEGKDVFPADPNDARLATGRLVDKYLDLNGNLYANLHFKRTKEYGLRDEEETVYRALQKIVKKALQPKPEARFKDAGQMLAEINKCNDRTGPKRYSIGLGKSIHAVADRSKTALSFFTKVKKKINRGEFWAITLSAVLIALVICFLLPSLGWKVLGVEIRNWGHVEILCFYLLIPGAAGYLLTLLLDGVIAFRGEYNFLKMFFISLGVGIFTILAVMLSYANVFFGLDMAQKQNTTITNIIHRLGSNRMLAVAEIQVMPKKTFDYMHIYALFLPVLMLEKGHIGSFIDYDELITLIGEKGISGSPGQDKLHLVRKGVAKLLLSCGDDNMSLCKAYAKHLEITFPDESYEEIEKTLVEGIARILGLVEPPPHKVSISQVLEQQFGSPTLTVSLVGSNIKVAGSGYPGNRYVTIWGGDSAKQVHCLYIESFSKTICLSNRIDTTKFDQIVVVVCDREICRKRDVMSVNRFAEVIGGGKKGNGAWGIAKKSTE